ncbi:hypothetical protein JW859_05915, partial [bacterium]|nr:hypothetical protein [bacterium]
MKNTPKTIATGGLQTALILLLTGILLLCASCGGSSTSGTAVPGRLLLDAVDDGQGRPSYCDLESLLLAELARLGKDPSSTASLAPTGDANAVFDLTATAID